MTIINRDDQKRAIMKSMVGLMQNLEKLSPHPDRPNYRGALFTALPGWCKAPGEYEGMAGNIILGGLLGTAFAQVAANCSAHPTESLNMANLAANALEAYDIYKSETQEQRQQAAAHGRGTLARMSGTSIAKSFNMRGSLSTAMRDFLDDMPVRLKIEGQLAHLLKRLKALDAPLTAPSLRFAA